MNNSAWWRRITDGIVTVVILWAGLAQIAPGVFQIRGGAMRFLFGWLTHPNIAWVILPLAVGYLLWRIRDLEHRYDQEFRTWLTAQEANWQRHFDAFATRARDEWETAKVAIERSHESHEQRLSKLEGFLNQTQGGQQG